MVRWLVLTLSLGIGAAGLAQPPGAAGTEDDGRLALATQRDQPRRVRRWDYSRFSNGPRRVPQPRGASLRRAQALGIGELEATRRILRGRISRELRDAVPGERPRTLLWPVVGGRWGRGFGYTRRVRKDLRHNGVDIGAERGDAVRAAAAGLVIYSDNTLRGLGNAVVVLHPGGWTTLYAHNQRNTVQPGWRVKRGERIALVGATGIARGPHLHFELRQNGRLIDPAKHFVGQQSEKLAGPLVELGAGSGSGADSASGSASESDSGAGSDSGSDSDRVSVDSLVRGLSASESAGRRFSNLLWPMKGGGPGRGFSAEHRALDLDAQEGAGVRAAADGVVLFAGTGLAGYGQVVVLQHRRGWVTVYGSLREVDVQPGAKVLRGEWLGRVGRVRSDGRPHLHFEWLDDGRRRDPTPHLVGAPRDPVSP